MAHKIEFTNLNVFICEYKDAEDEDTINTVGPVPICQVHNENSKWEFEYGPHRPCLAIDPW